MTDEANEISEVNIQDEAKIAFNLLIMWPIVYALIRRNAVYLTLPVAVVVGVIGYNVESKNYFEKISIQNFIKGQYILDLISSKYTPYEKSIQDHRIERQTDDDELRNAANHEKLKYKENVFGKNISPSLQQK